MDSKLNLESFHEVRLSDPKLVFQALGKAFLKLRQLAKGLFELELNVAVLAGYLSIEIKHRLLELS